MAIFSRLTAAMILLAVGAWVFGAPPRVTGNRPVVIEVPHSDAEPAGSDPAATAADEHGFLAALLRDEGNDVAPGENGSQRNPTAELKRAREQLLKCSSISARIVEKVDIYDKGYKAEGRYLQKALKPN